MSVSTVTLLATICAVAYSFQHPSMNVDYASPSPISFRKYACTIQPEIFNQANLQGIAGDPLGGVDGRALILFHSMCGQFVSTSLPYFMCLGVWELFANMGFDTMYRIFHGSLASWLSFLKYLYWVVCH